MRLFEPGEQPAPGRRRISASRTLRPGSWPSDRDRSRTAPCEGGYRHRLESTSRAPPIEARIRFPNTPVIGKALQGSTTSTSQSTTPFQFGMGSARNWNLRPTTGSKSLFIIHCARSGLSVSARHSFSGGCGNTLSTTRVREAVAAWIAHGSILSKSSSRRSNRSRQKAP